MKWLIMCATLMFGIGCSTTFFGGKVDSEYKEHFNGKMICAYVDGWYNKRKCMCFLTEDDPRLRDKTLLASDPVMCVAE